MNITEIDIGRQCTTSFPNVYPTFDTSGRQVNGTIVDIYPSEPKIGIRFEESNTIFHNCNNKCEEHHGYYMYSNKVKIIDESMSRCDSIW